MNNAVLRLSSSKSFSCLHNIMLRCEVLQTQTILYTHDHKLGMIVLIILATRTFADDAHMLQTAHIINIVNIFDKEFSTAQIYWVLPYQVGGSGYIQNWNTKATSKANTNTSGKTIEYTNTTQILYEQGDESKADEERHMIEMSSILEKFSRCNHLHFHLHCHHEDFDHYN